MKNQPLIFGIKFIILLMLITVLTASGSESGPGEINRLPQWAKEAIWYQISPERFRNGDRTNDPAPQDIAGGWPFFIPENWQVHPWTSDWYQFQPWEKDIE